MGRIIASVVFIVGWSAHAQFLGPMRPLDTSPPFPSTCVPQTSARINGETWVWCYEFVTSSSLGADVLLYRLLDDGGVAVGTDARNGQANAAFARDGGGAIVLRRANQLLGKQFMTSTGEHDGYEFLVYANNVYGEGAIQGLGFAQHVALGDGGYQVLVARTDDAPGYDAAALQPGRDWRYSFATTGTLFSEERNAYAITRARSNGPPVVEALSLQPFTPRGVITRFDDGGTYGSPFGVSGGQFATLAYRAGSNVHLLVLQDGGVATEYLTAIPPNGLDVTSFNDQFTYWSASGSSVTRARYSASRAPVLTTYSMPAALNNPLLFDTANGAEVLYTSDAGNSVRARLFDDGGVGVPVVATISSSRQTLHSAGGSSQSCVVVFSDDRPDAGAPTRPRVSRRYTHVIGSNTINEVPAWLLSVCAFQGATYAVGFVPGGGNLMVGRLDSNGALQASSTFVNIPTFGQYPVNCAATDDTLFFGFEGPTGFRLFGMAPDGGARPGLVSPPWTIDAGSINVSAPAASNTTMVIARGDLFGPRELAWFDSLGNFRAMHTMGSNFSLIGVRGDEVVASQTFVPSDGGASFDSYFSIFIDGGVALLAPVPTSLGGVRPLMHDDELYLFVNNTGFPTAVAPLLLELRHVLRDGGVERRSTSAELPGSGMMPWQCGDAGFGVATASRAIWYSTTQSTCFFAADCGAGAPDAGVPDAGVSDAGLEVDGGIELDSGVSTDAGLEVDAGPGPDSGLSDAGSTSDGGLPTQGPFTDGGALADAGGASGQRVPVALKVGCDCSGSPQAPVLCAALLLAQRRFRRTRS